MLKIVNPLKCFRTYANNALGADQLDEFIGNCALAIALGISLEVSEISYMANLVLWSTVGLAVRVDYCASISLVEACI